MKKVLILTAAVLAAAACASNNKNLPQSSKAASLSQTDITDQEFDNVQAPKLNYESNVSYEDQLRAQGTYIRGIRGKNSSSAVK